MLTFQKSELVLITTHIYIHMIIVKDGREVNQLIFIYIHNYFYMLIVLLIVI